MGTQPWLSIYNPAADLWCSALMQAVAQRPAVKDALQRSLSRSWVRPSLEWQVAQQHPNPWTMPRSVRQLDQDWLPPHLQTRPVQTGRRLQLLRWHWSSVIRAASGYHWSQQISTPTAAYFVLKTLYPRSPGVK